MLVSDALFSSSFAFVSVVGFTRLESPALALLPICLHCVCLTLSVCVLSFIRYIFRLSFCVPIVLPPRPRPSSYRELYTNWKSPSFQLGDDENKQPIKDGANMAVTDAAKSHATHRHLLRMTIPQVSNVPQFKHT